MPLLFFCLFSLSTTWEVSTHAPLRGATLHVSDAFYIGAKTVLCANLLFLQLKRRLYFDKSARKALCKPGANLLGISCSLQVRTSLLTGCLPDRMFVLPRYVPLAFSSCSLDSNSAGCLFQDR